MKHWLLLAALICFGSSAMASYFSVKPGLDAGSFGAIIVHDFRNQSTLHGLEWDGLHIAHNSVEVAEVGAFFAQEDVSRNPILGPSFGCPGGALGSLARNAQELVDWPALKVLESYGQYVHAYINVGWDVTHPKDLHASPNIVGVGGVLKFGSIK